MTDKKTVVKSKLVSFRIDLATDKKLNEVAKFKKQTRTAIIKDLIRLAHIGIFSPEAQKLNKYFKNMISQESRTELHKQLNKLNKFNSMKDQIAKTEFKRKKTVK